MLNLRSPRPIACYVTFAAVSILLSACGGGDKRVARAAATSITKAEAAAFVNTVSLDQADLSGWVRESAAGTFRVTTADIAAARCVGGVDPSRLVLAAYSPSYYERETGALRSEVVVWPSAALAADDAKAALSARGLACLRSEEPHERRFKVGGTTVRRVLKGIARLPAPIPGAPYAGALRTTWIVHEPARRHAFPGTGIAPRLLPPATFNVYEDVFSFVAGPAEVSLVATASGKAMNATTEVDALMTIYERAEALKP